jgi:hypothetical protein
MILTWGVNWNISRDRCRVTHHQCKQPDVKWQVIVDITRKLFSRCHLTCVKRHSNTWFHTIFTWSWFINNVHQCLSCIDKELCDMKMELIVPVNTLKFKQYIHVYWWKLKEKNATIEWSLFASYPLSHFQHDSTTIHKKDWRNTSILINFIDIGHSFISIHQKDRRPG